ncbi:hypothetical protein ABAC460_10795 [Asticcacaulis sp. AC460]|uniref:DUF4352 domain-containing protein n=1 Tax=Asticcacaulis sp. AC460 TaxID=1282360 RepID=UPI0003C3ACBF|nr:DUF4352 domain-containing protein [Asticcacaulis sp. AC460]ESQ90228.1 hypothetical protein ABAC460_10795 [Asticcacaulis sp. AC460]
MAETENREAAMRHVLLACTVLIAVTACSPKGGVPAASSSVAAGVHYIDQTVKVGNAEVVVNEMWSIVDYPEAPKGAVAVAVRWTVHNAGDKPLTDKAFPVMRLVDGKGVVYNPDKALTEAIRDDRAMSDPDGSDLNPGLAETRLAVFEVAAARFNLSDWYMLPADGVKMAFCSQAQALDGKCPASMGVSAS